MQIRPGKTIGTYLVPPEVRTIEAYASPIVGIASRVASKIFDPFIKRFVKRFFFAANSSL